MGLNLLCTVHSQRQQLLLSYAVTLLWLQLVYLASLYDDRMTAGQAMKVVRRLTRLAGNRPDAARSCVFPIMFSPLLLLIFYIEPSVHYIRTGLAPATKGVSIGLSANFTGQPNMAQKILG